MAQNINVPDPINAMVPFNDKGTPSGLSQFGVKQLSDTQTAISALIAQVATLNAQVAALNAKVGL